MNLVDAVAAPFRWARRRTPRFDCPDPRILVIRRNKMGDMIYTLPLLHSLRLYFPAAHIAVACDEPGFSIAQACSAVDEVILLRTNWNRWLSLLRDGWDFRHFDWVLAAKNGFDQRLGILTRLSNAARRIGYHSEAPSRYYTSPLPISADAWRIHQIEATQALLEPLGVTLPPNALPDLHLDLPASALAFAAKLDPWLQGRRLALINISSTKRLRFSDADFGALITTIARDPRLVIGIVGLPGDLERGERLAAGGQARVIEIPGRLELAAVLGRAAFLVTGEGGAIHLAAATGTPALVLWSEGAFEKWYSRGRNHTFVRFRKGEDSIPLERVISALQPYLAE